MTILIETLCQRFFQVRSLFMITPKICIPFILTIGSLTCFCGFLNIMNFDLAELRDNLLIFNQVLISVNSLFNLLLLLRLLILANNVVSSACTMNFIN